MKVIKGLAYWRQFVDRPLLACTVGVINASARACGVGGNASSLETPAWEASLGRECSLRSMVVLSGARQSGEAARKKDQAAPALISSRFLCTRPPLLFNAPNQNRHAT